MTMEPRTAPGLRFRESQWRSRPLFPRVHPQKDVAGGLRQSLPFHDGLAAIGRPPPCDEGRQHPPARLLHLQKARVVVRGHEQVHRAEGSDPPDAHDLEGEVCYLAPIQEPPAVVGLVAEPQVFWADRVAEESSMRIEAMVRRRSSEARVMSSPPGALKSDRHLRGQPSGQPH